MGWIPLNYATTKGIGAFVISLLFQFFFFDIQETCAVQEFVGFFFLFRDLAIYV